MTDQLFDIETVEALDVIAEHFDEDAKCAAHDCDRPAEAVIAYACCGSSGAAGCHFHVEVQANDTRARLAIQDRECSRCATRLLPSLVITREV